MRHLALTFSTLVFGFLALGCATDGDQASEAPAIGKADSTDRADRDCQIVLRGVSYDVNDYEDDWLVWTGTVDVADAADTAQVGVLYSPGGSSWYEVAAEPVSGAPSGFQRYQFRMFRNIYRGGSGSSAWFNLHVRFIPVLHLADGSRLFDHNRIEDDFGTYELTYAGGLKILDNGACAAAEVHTPDRDCRVVLRAIDYDVNDYESDWLVWTAQVDVREDLADTSDLAIRYSTASNWWDEAVGEPVAGGVDGYQRYRVRLWKFIYRGGSGSAAWNTLRLQVMPVLDLGNGTFLYDHNRVDGALDNYVLTAQSNDFSVSDDPSICR